jgi:hypothetical protein
MTANSPRPLYTQCMNSKMLKPGVLCPAGRLRSAFIAGEESSPSGRDAAAVIRRVQCCPYCVTAGRVAVLPANRMDQKLTCFRISARRKVSCICNTYFTATDRPASCCRTKLLSLLSVNIQPFPRGPPGRRENSNCTVHCALCTALYTMHREVCSERPGRIPTNTFHLSLSRDIALTGGPVQCSAVQCSG